MYLMSCLCVNDREKKEGKDTISFINRLKGDIDNEDFIAVHISTWNPSWMRSLEK